MLLLVYGIVEAPTAGWTSPRTLGMFTASMMLLAFVVIERRTAQPLLRLGMLRNGALVGASLVAAAILGTYMSFQFIGGLYLQSLRGWSPMQMALAFLPVGLLIAAIAPRARHADLEVRGPMDDLRGIRRLHRVVPALPADRRAAPPRPCPATTTVFTSSPASPPRPCCSRSSRRCAPRHGAPGRP
ncbi:hypothetical protein [Microbispora sp. NPDC049633]|uniref:hypothetical protein n=1 Tax=Microbispora sp. NPDC049633 TaxID=3154355 RepID=UPI003434D372